MRKLVPPALALLLAVPPSPLRAQPFAERFLRLLEARGVSGHEEEAREAVRSQLPAWARPEVDGIGNLVVTFGSGEPRVALVAALDERGYAVSRITAEGYLRLHRHTAPWGHPLGDQLFAGQPVVVGTAGGGPVPGVAATPSTHLSGLTAPAEVARLRNVEDLWIDVGARNPDEVAALGIRLLDPVSLRERATALAGGRFAGIESGRRAGAQALVEILRALPPERAAAAGKGTWTFAWVVQSRFRSRGLARLAREVVPGRAYLAGFELPGDPDGAGPAAPPPPAGWEGVPLAARPLPTLFPDTPVEVVAARDLAALARDLAALAGLPAPPEPFPPGAPAAAPPVSASAPPPPPSAAPIAGILRELIELSGVSGAEEPVRQAVLRHLPGWAKPRVDEKGNVTVTFGGGPQGGGGREILFVAHLDEVGFEVASLGDDGSAAVRPRGGMYLSLYEGHPVLVQTAKGAVPALLAPRPGYAAAAAAQPGAEELALYFGTASAAETRALGVAPGDTATVRKRLAGLAGGRFTGRAMDDRVGTTALLLALRQLDPAAVKNRVTFAWSVAEETGLAGAAHLATYLRPEIAFAVDTFVSTDTPVDLGYLAHAELGAGPVLRGLDNATVVPAATMTRLQEVARRGRIPLQLGVTQGGTDASAFSARGAVDVGLSWPGRYSHSPVEVMDLRDLEGLARLIALLAGEL